MVPAARGTAVIGIGNAPTPERSGAPSATGSVAATVIIVAAAVPMTATVTVMLSIGGARRHSERTGKHDRNCKDFDELRHRSTSDAPKFRLIMGKFAERRLVPPAALLRHNDRAADAIFLGQPGTAMPHGIAGDPVTRMNRDARARDLLSVNMAIVAVIQSEHLAGGIVAAEEFSPCRRRNPGREGQDQRQKTKKHRFPRHNRQPYPARHNG